MTRAVSAVENLGSDPGGEMSRLDVRRFLGGGVDAGTEFGVEIKFLAWISVGSGEVLLANEHAMGLSVRASLFGQEKRGRVQLILEPPTSDTGRSFGGACSICVGRQIDGEGRYRVEEGEITVEGRVYDQDVLIRAHHDGAHCIVQMKKPRSVKFRLTFDKGGA